MLIYLRNCHYNFWCNGYHICNFTLHYSSKINCALHSITGWKNNQIIAIILCSSKHNSNLCKTLSVKIIYGFLINDETEDFTYTEKTLEDVNPIGQ